MMLHLFFQQLKILGRSPGLMVMGGDSCSEGCEFKSLHCILDGHFSHIFVEKNVMCVTKTKINKKEAGVGPFYYSKNSSKFHLNQ